MGLVEKLVRVFEEYTVYRYPSSLRSSRFLIGRSVSKQKFVKCYTSIEIPGEWRYIKQKRALRVKRGRQLSCQVKSYYFMMSVMCGRQNLLLSSQCLQYPLTIVPGNLWWYITTDFGTALDWAGNKLLSKPILWFDLLWGCVLCVCVCV